MTKFNIEPNTAINISILTEKEFDELARQLLENYPSFLLREKPNHLKSFLQRKKEDRANLRSRFLKFKPNRIIINSNYLGEAKEIFPLSETFRNLYKFKKDANILSRSEPQESSSSTPQQTHSEDANRNSTTHVYRVPPTHSNTGTAYTISFDPR